MTHMMKTPPTIHKTDLPELVNRGKVRDLYKLGGRMMIIATDRISAFDVVMNEPVPGKGVLLTQMSRFWLQTLPACLPHHLDYVVDDEQIPVDYAPYVDQLRGRAMVVKRVEILPIECIVRGYIIGSGWKEYQASGTISGVKLPAGLRRAERLPMPVFTPSTKAVVGHDVPITFDQAIETTDRFLATKRSISVEPGELMEQVRRRSLDIYSQAARHAEERGIILADTKFEFGLHNGELLLADEVLTPDSSRFWPLEHYRIGDDQPSFDKQFLRDYLESIGWNKQPPPPPIPDEIIARTHQGYEDVYRRLTS
ncbi:MAG: phosphoribosylaminoimidazolesuccinocarboxamide synthase [Phycisphaerae bacterium]|nr:phosphoribosylaminoimidazolesuccinocarboxamide synthase [Phycisphaerae bacterium]